MTLVAGPVCGVADSGSGNSDREQQHDPERDGADVAQHHGVARPAGEQQREHELHGGEDGVGQRVNGPRCIGST
ncbi:hypothetical protein [Micromonospora sp. KC723]|uniref:hypothetical protein n=1 Tax=Micromonospora sp. KC723 TaxID=2530381 RepID=UPI001049304C|nr:hypothetical protein [Micromonospora sp. KC723]TDB70672.1 hypothetical protein E1165_25060 [Micromonospora sp. KC723]